MKNNLILIFIFLNTITYSQDWCGWSFEYNFELKNNQSYKLDSFVIYVNEPFNNSNFSNGKLFQNDSSTNYSILLKCSCVSCGYEGIQYPPTIFIQL